MGAGDPFPHQDASDPTGHGGEYRSRTGTGGPAPRGDAESHFLRAIEISRRQRARSLELRATVSLSRPWADQGEVREASALLSGIYGWFTEGFGTLDLSEAKSRLEELETLLTVC